jgi:hypothetical protein
VPLRNFADLAPAADIAARAVGGVAAGSASVLAAGAKLADLTRALRSYRAPRMPPELAAKVDQALAAEVARRSSASSRPPEPRPAPPARPAAASGDRLHHLIQIPAPRAPMAGF